MGNTVVKLTPCLAGREADESAPQPREADESAPQPRSQWPVPVTTVAPDEEGIGQTIIFKRDSDTTTSMPFQAIHCVSMGANQLTPSSIPSSIMNEYSLSSSSSFDRSSSFSSFALHPSSSSFSSSDPSYSGILVRSDSKTIFQEIQAARDRRIQEKKENPSLLRRFTSAVSTRIKKYKGLSACASVAGTFQKPCDEGKSDPGAVHWAQGKAGEDRVHVVYSEEHQLLFVGIYDGFNGPDAPDFLLANLYQDILFELEGIQWEQQQHQLVLDAMSSALKRADEEYLSMADTNPELAVVGSCVLVMLMKGEDLYLMNVGDSRAVLAQKAEPDLSGVLGRADEDLERLKVEIMRQLEAYERDNLSGLVAIQLTMDHSTAVYQEVRRIRSEHLDDPCPISKGRVKGTLKVTRAFGAGFLKQPKYNRAILEVYKVDYIGTSPYISCNPYLRHHKVDKRDRFLILSSDGLYDHFRNDEVVTQVEMFTSMHPEADPAHHLAELILRSAALKAGKDVNDLIGLPQGERRKYHDDVSIVIISLDGKIWRSTPCLDERNNDL
ncbi:hypothetical protein FCM35_KLT03867 [Carex littledalei]|uniref:protein-serine/threonine phosphatase n=1 Tax=Carex littledalei TaxID=544730 RepID=A0A833QYZ9_9POAL|nr:hypothetical protein FCM35_KLT03867 [Carex littledalei]